MLIAMGTEAGASAHHTTKQRTVHILLLCRKTGAVIPFLGTISIYFSGVCNVRSILWPDGCTYPNSLQLDTGERTKKCPKCLWFHISFSSTHFLSSFMWSDNQCVCTNVIVAFRWCSKVCRVTHIYIYLHCGRCVTTHYSPICVIINLFLAKFRRPITYNAA